MKIFVTGSDGNIGRALLERGCSPLNCDVTDFESVRDAVSQSGANVIIHLAGKSDAAWCENPSNQDLARKTNVDGTMAIAEACDNFKIPFITVSTEHVFSGRLGRFREKDVRHVKPTNWYGWTKFGAEVCTWTSPHGMVVRSSTLFGEDSKTIKEYESKLKAGTPIHVPAFMTRSFMYLPYFASSLLQVANEFNQFPKLLHIAGRDTVSWYMFMRRFAYVFGYDQHLVIPRHRPDNALTPRNFKGGLNVSRARHFGLVCPSYLVGLDAMRDARK